MDLQCSFSLSHWAQFSVWVRTHGIRETLHKSFSVSSCNGSPTDQEMLLQLCQATTQSKYQLYIQLPALRKTCQMMEAFMLDRIPSLFRRMYRKFDKHFLLMLYLFPHCFPLFFTILIYNNYHIKPLAFHPVLCRSMQCVCIPYTK